MSLATPFHHAFTSPPRSEDAERGYHVVRRDGYKVPVHERGLHNPLSQSIILSNGYNVGRKEFTPLAVDLSGGGERVTTFDNIRPIRAMLGPHSFKQETLRAVAENHDAEAPTLVAYSEGAISAVRYACQELKEGKGDSVGELVLIGPAGIGTTSVAELGYGGAMEIMHPRSLHVYMKLGMKAAFNSLDYNKNIGLNTEEMIAISMTDIRDDIHFLLQHGVPVSVIICELDHIFHPKTTLRRLRELAGQGLEVYTVNATHMEVLASDDVTETILEAVNAARIRKKVTKGLAQIAQLSH